MKFITSIKTPNGTLAVLTRPEHRGNASILNTIWDNSPVKHDAVWDTTRKAFWKSLGNIYANAA